MMKEYPCTLASVPIDYRKLGNGMLFQKNWPYSALINFHLFKVGEFNVLSFYLPKFYFRILISN